MPADTHNSLEGPSHFQEVCFLDGLPDPGFFPSHVTSPTPSGELSLCPPFLCDVFCPFDRSWRGGLRRPAKGSLGVAFFPLDFAIKMSFILGAPVLGTGLTSSNYGSAGT